MLGDRWTLLIFRELLIQPCRFRELNQYLPGMGTNLLSSRLKELEERGLVEKTESGRKHVPYVPTVAGRDVEAVLLSLIRWGYLHAEPQRDYLHFDHWDLLAMKAFFRAENCESSMGAQFQCLSLNAWVNVSSDGFSHGMGEHGGSPDVVINSSIVDFRDDLQDGHYFYNAEAIRFANCFEFPGR